VEAPLLEAVVLRPEEVVEGVRKLVEDP